MRLIPRNKACWSVVVLDAVLTKMVVADELAQSQIKQVQRHDPPDSTYMAFGEESLMTPICRMTAAA